MVSNLIEELAISCSAVHVNFSASLVASVYMACMGYTPNIN